VKEDGVEGAEGVADVLELIVEGVAVVAKPVLEAFEAVARAPALWSAAVSAALDFVDQK